MPKSQLHEVKKKKNYAVLLALAAFVLVVFFVSIIRMKQGLGG
jgi:hypothetical protein